MASPSAKPSASGKSITIVLAAAGVEAELVKKTISQTLGGSKAHPNKLSLIEVESPYSFPYIVKKIVKTNSTDIVIAVAVKIGSERDSIVPPILIKELLHIGMTGTIPVIPSIIQPLTLSGLKANIADICESWACSIDDVIDGVKITTIETKMTSEIDVKCADLKTDDLITAFRSSLKAHGASGIFGIARKFKIIDDDSSGQIDISEFTKCIAEHAHDWNANNIKKLFDFFDKDKSGSISYDEFLVSVREKMNERRYQFVLQAFEVSFHFIVYALYVYLHNTTVSHNV